VRGALLLAALLAAACDATVEGRKHYAAGRFEEAFRAFDRAAAGEASPELHYDRALAALRSGDLEATEASAAAVARLGGDAFEGRSHFLRGSAAFARAGRTEEASKAPGADATAHERAVAHAEDAVARFRLACASRDDWPEARRNLERAMLLLDRLRERRSDRKEKPPPKPPPRPPPEAPKPEPSGEKSEEEAPVELVRTELRPEEILALFERLREKEAEKAALRRERRAAGAGGAERDW